MVFEGTRDFSSTVADKSGTTWWTCGDCKVHMQDMNFRACPPPVARTRP